MEAERTSPAFISWEEMFVSNDRGNRESCYYLKRKDGSSALAVVGKEKSLRHMSYHYAIRDKDLLSISANSSKLKLRSRREVIDWLNSIIAGLDLHPHQGSICGNLEVKNDFRLNFDSVKDGQLRKIDKHTSDFLWLGSALVCRKRRKHYKLFQRNDVKISVNDFVYVLAEEDKRLVAYLDDMYEDSKGNKMVVVRWFHKIDEVGIALPQNYNGREILFSLCLQVLNIECIDGLASVLSPQHYEKFLREVTHSQLDPFVCHRQFDNDDVKPFDITQLKGYAEQEILKYMFTTSPSITFMKSQPDNDGLKVEVNCTDAVELRPKKRLRHSKEFEMYLPPANNAEVSDACLEVPDSIGCSIISKGGSQMSLPKEGCSAVSLTTKEEVTQNHQQPLMMGAQVEVLSQDSGIRGCWFRALIIKKFKDKVKVQYKDIKDAADEVNNLEEWILVSRIAIPDKWSLRSCGRTTIRPAPLFGKDGVAWVVKNGSVVDVWWHNCWWEGIVIRKESEDKIHVYFPAEKKISIFPLKDLRPSQEWLGTGWIQIKERPELVTPILSDLERKLNVVISCDERSAPHRASTCDYDNELVSYVHKDALLISNTVNETSRVRNLAKDDLLAQLRWKSSRKRKHSRNSSQKLYDGDSKNKSSVKVLGTRTWEKYFIPSASKVDNDNCKYTMDSAFSSSVVSPLTSLVLSR